MPPKRSTKPTTKDQNTAAAPTTSRTVRKRGAENVQPDAEAPAKRPKRATTTTTTVKAASTKVNGRVTKAKPKTTSTKKAAKSKSPEKEDEEDASLQSQTNVADRTASPQASTAKASSQTTAPKKTKRTILPPKPNELFNPLPSTAEHVRPPRQAFVFGTGDSGQFGLGPDVMGEFGRPKLHTWVDEAIQEDKIGGLEQLAAGGMHTLIIDESGKIWSWGVNDEGALGRHVNNVPSADNPDVMMDREELETTPMAVEGLNAEEFRAAVIAAGDNISVALSTSGELRGWGSFHSNEGSLGFGNTTDRVQLLPTSLNFPSRTFFSSVAAGENHVLALTTKGLVFAWGASQMGQLGRLVLERRKINGTTPQSLQLRHIVHVGCGAFHSFAVDKDGNVYGWGSNTMGQLGIPLHGEDGKGDLGSNTENVVHIPKLVEALSPEKLGGAKVVKIAGGSFHTLFLLSDGRVFACGGLEYGQLGIADDHPVMKSSSAANHRFISTPTHIPFPPLPTEDDPDPAVQTSKPADNPIVHISVGPRHNLAVSKHGHAYSWGFGPTCQLGLGADTEDQRTPARIRWKDIQNWEILDAAAGGQHCLLLARKRS